MSLNFDWEGIKRFFKTSNVLATIGIFVLAILLACSIAVFSVIFSSGCGLTTNYYTRVKGVSLIEHTRGFYNNGAIARIFLVVANPTNQRIHRIVHCEYFGEKGTIEEYPVIVDPRSDKMVEVKSVGNLNCYLIQDPLPGSAR